MTIKEIQNIIKDFESSPLMTLELEMEGFRLKLSKNKNEDKKESSIIVKEEINKNKSMEHEINPLLSLSQTMIKSPLVGTFYASSTPQGKPFVEVGSIKVKKGQVVCIIEAMKIMNEITSPFDGIIKEIMVKNGDVMVLIMFLMRVGDSNEK